MLAAITITPFINETSFPAAKFSDLGKILNLLLPLSGVVAALIFLVMILQAAFIILTGEGKPDNVAKAQKMLMFAVIGLLLVISAFVIVKLIGVIFNIQDVLPI